MNKGLGIHLWDFPSSRNKPFRHLSFRDRFDPNTLMLRHGLVESRCRVGLHMRSESGQWLL